MLVASKRGATVVVVRRSVRPREPNATFGSGTGVHHFRMGTKILEAYFKSRPKIPMKNLYFFIDDCHKWALCIYAVYY